MSSKKIIAVVGSTGSQGGGLVRAILSDVSNGFTARAITRDVNSDKAKEPAKMGAEDLGNMFRFKRDFEEVYCGARSLEVSRALNLPLETFDQWLAQNKSRIPLE